MFTTMKTSKTLKRAMTKMKLNLFVEKLFVNVNFWFKTSRILFFYFKSIAFSQDTKS